MIILLTGATGFIGCKILNELLKRKYKVRVIVRENSNIEKIKKLKVETFFGDITNKKSIDRAIRGSDYIIHSASLYSLWLPNKELIYKVNVDGTKNMLELALKYKIKKFIYTSTVATISSTKKNKFSNEYNFLKIKEIKFDYTKSKFLAEQEVFKFNKLYKLPTIILNPTIVVGEGDSRPTPSGQLIINFLKGKIPAFFNGGGNFVDVNDVAIWHVEALTKGRSGERYILGNENLSLINFFEYLKKITNYKKNLVKLPTNIVLTYALLSEFYAKYISKKQPIFTSEGTKIISNSTYCNCYKTFHEFSLPKININKSLINAINWFKINKYL